MSEQTDGGFRFGMVVKNSNVQDFVVMALGPGRQERGYPHSWEVDALVLKDRDRGPSSSIVFTITTIHGMVGRNYGEWWVVES